MYCCSQCSLLPQNWQTKLILFSIIKITITIANASKGDNINNSLFHQILSVPGVINIPVCKKHYII